MGVFPQYGPYTFGFACNFDCIHVCGGFNQCFPKLSITDFLVSAPLRTEIQVSDDIKPLLIELKRIGNNINQITMKINAGAFSSADFSEVIQGQRLLYEKLLHIAGKN